MSDERKADTEKEQGSGKFKKRIEPMTVVLIAGCAAVFAGLAVDGLKYKDDGDSASDETSASAATSTTTTVTTAAAQSTSSSASLPAAETAADTLTAQKTVTAPLKTLTMTTTTVTTTSMPRDTALTETAEETSVSTTTAAQVTTTAERTTTQTVTSAQSFPADINAISYEGLREVPGIGETLARQIIDFREANGTIYNMEQLMGIYGIGEGTLAQLRAFLYVSAADYSELTTTTAASVTVTETETRAPAQRQQVRLNSADAEELAQKLLISLDKAAAIIEVRGKIVRFTSADELRLVDKLTAEDLRGIKDYVIID